MSPHPEKPAATGAAEPAAERPPPRAPSPPRIFASDASWIEGAARAQLDQTAHALGMRAAVGMPDLHPGKGVPNGAAFLHETRLFPHLIGEDVGCGYALFHLELSARKLAVDKAAARLGALEDAAAARRAEVWEAANAMTTEAPRLEASEIEEATRRLGAVGGGNHFVELQRLDAIDDAGDAALADAGVGAGALFLLVHSGSRGLGAALLRRHLAEHGARGLAGEDDAAAAYLAEHDGAAAWAKANRLALGLGAADRLRAKPRLLFDVAHNAIERRPEGWLHRKGAQPADRPALVVPGSRGEPTHWVRPHARAEALWSIAHGAGRKWARGEAKARLGARARDLTRTRLGGHVLCGDRALLFEEAPEAYKPIAQVLADLSAFDLIEPVAALTPLVTYKSPPAAERGASGERNEPRRRRRSQ